MHRFCRNANFHLFFFVRHRFWPLLIPSVITLFLIFCPQVSHSTEIDVKDYKHANEYPDRTVAIRGSRDIQLTTTLTPSTLSIPSTSNVDEFIHILYVISLDGKLTAIDAHANGRQLWTADTGAALIDSSLSKIEISRDARSVRLIPSLIGGLFEKYDEDGHIEPLPFDADDLLTASYSLHEELAITGGKHIDTLGLDLHTGQVIYSFSNDDPKQTSTRDNNRTTKTTADHTEVKATLVVKRTTQTVRARSARSGHEKWNFSVSHHQLLHLRAQSGSVVLGKVDRGTTFSGYFEYQLQSGIVSAVDKSGKIVWNSIINAPIAAVWELKNGQLIEKSLFEPTAKKSDYFSEDNIDDDDDDDPIPSIPKAKRIAFSGEFNSTPYVIISPSDQKKLIHDAKIVSGSHSNRRPVLSWHKAYQKRTLSISSENPDSHDQPLHALSIYDNKYPVALRRDQTKNHKTIASPTDERCDTAGFLEYTTESIRPLIGKNDKINFSNGFNTRSNVYVAGNLLTLYSAIIGLLIIIVIFYCKQNQFGYKRQESMMTETSTTTTPVTPISTPDYNQLEPSVTPSFQSRYTLEYEHVRFLGRGGFGVVFEAINKLDERRVAIKRVSLKKASGKERALKEIRYLAVLNHPNLIQYYYAWNESPPVGWQEKEDETLLVRNSITTRDSMSTFPTSANDSESINQAKCSKASSLSAIKPSTAHSPPSLFDITFDRSSNPLRIDEDFSSNSINNNENKSDMSFSSSSDNQRNIQLDANNNNKSTKIVRSSTTIAKRSLSSSSPLYDYSSDSSISSNEFNEKTPSQKETTESDDGIVFLYNEQRSSSSPPSPIQTHTNSLIEKKKSIVNEKDIPTIYFYFVMELCQPESLRDRLTKRSIDRHQAWSIFDQITKGIEYIHSQKLIHRDLKPSNILFSMDNTVKIGDFGLVSAFGEDKSAKKKKRDDDNFDLCQSNEITSISTTTTDACENNELGGTMLYMSPEQISRQQYNQKVDIYAMGIILFELLYPFSTQMERMQALAKVRLHSPVFPKDFEVDGNNRNQLICRLIRWLLSHSSHDRPRASELRQDTFYQRMLQLEVPHLFAPDNRQQNPTIVNGQDQTLLNASQTQLHRNLSSSVRRSLSSSALQSHRESDSADSESLS